MPVLTDILTGFDAIRAEGAAYVVDVDASTPFTLVDVDRLLALHGPSPTRLTPAVGDLAGVPGDTRVLIWRRRDGAFGALATLDVGGRRVTIEPDGHALRLRVVGDGGSRPAAAFAVAGDPFVAADFCRVAAARAIGTDETDAGDARLTADVRPGEAVYRDAVTSVWTKTVTPAAALQTDGVDAAFRAAARAVAAGPPAKVTRDRLFVDVTREPRLLKVFTHKGRDGVLGLFHCNADAPAITDTWRVDDVDGLGGEQFAAWHVVERKLFIIGRGVDETVTLSPLGAELVHLVPILQNVAPLGLIDRLDASAAMTRVGSRKCRLADGGRVGWYAAARPACVTLDGEPVAFDYDRASGLASFDAPAGMAHESEVTL